MDLHHIKTLPAGEAVLAPSPGYVGPDRPRLRFLGTGTSAGVPVLGCNCAVCKSGDPRDRRLRTAALLTTKEARILIDAGPDIRQQLLPLDFYPLDAILLTHIHYDHTGGLDDIRGFCIFGDQHVYASAATCKGVRHNMPYCFSRDLYPGVPLLKLHAIRPHKAFKVKDVTVLPVKVMHGNLPILGFRFGKLAYITDMKSIADEEMAYLEGVETLVVNALRWDRPHHSHILVNEALEFAERLKAKHTYLIHLTHRIGLHDEAEKRLPPGVHFAYDGLEIEI